MPKKLSIFTTVVAIVTLMVTLSTSAFAAPVLQEEQDIVTVAVEDGRFTTLATALEAAGLVETLQGEGPFTVFAPTDEAFAALPEGALDELLADTAALTDVLLYHVVEGQVMAADVVTLDTADTVLGTPVDITVDGDNVMVNEANVIITDIEATNGVIHVIDSVLLPPADDSAMMEEGEMMEATGDSVASCEDYTVQADDWLSRISERFLGDVLAYPTLVEATNAAAAESDRYTVIDNPDLIEIGQIICVPAETEEGSQMSDGEMAEDSEMAEDEAMVEGNTIVDVAVADGRFTTLVTALEAAGLVETLQGEGPFTVFAPTDEAFAALPEGALDELLADTAALTDVLLYHVVEGQVMAADVVNLDSADTVLGQPVSITVDGDNVMVGEANVIIPDVEASNGVIHVIDSVLLPASE